MGNITVNLSCPWKPKTCGEDPANCKCPPHLWVMSDLMGIMTPAFPGACDFAWFGPHADTTPCCATGLAGVLRVSYWGVNFQLIQDWYQVSVHFGPCFGKKGPPPPPPPPPNKPKEDPGKPPTGGGGGFGGGPGIRPPSVPPGAPADATLTVREGPVLDMANIPAVFQQPLGSAASSPVVDPNLSVLSANIVSSLDLAPGGGSTFALPVSLFNPQVLAMALDLRKRDTQDFLNAYYGRAQSSLNDTLDMLDSRPQLDLFVQGVLSVAGIPAVPPPHCGALGIEFLALLGLVRLLKRRRGQA